MLLSRFVLVAMTLASAPSWGQTTTDLKTFDDLKFNQLMALCRNHYLPFGCVRGRVQPPGVPCSPDFKPSFEAAYVAECKPIQDEMLRRRASRSVRSAPVAAARAGAVNGDLKAIQDLEQSR